MVKPSFVGATGGRKAETLPTAQARAGKGKVKKVNPSVANKARVAAKKAAKVKK